MLLSCSAKKVTKECGQRGAEAGRSRAQSRPLWNPPARTRHTLEHLNGQSTLPVYGHADSGGSALAALPINISVILRVKIGTFFVRTGCRLRCSRAIVSARRERYIEEGVFACGSKQRRPLLWRLLLVLFLAKQEKYKLILRKGIYSCKSQLQIGTFDARIIMTKYVYKRKKDKWKQRLKVSVCLRLC